MCFGCELSRSVEHNHATGCMDSTLDRIVSKHGMAHIAMDPILDCLVHKLEVPTADICTLVHKLEVPTADIHHHPPTDIREHQPVPTGSFVVQLFVVASFHPESTCL